ncbi:hypothetical protein F4808DRAFT_399407 [Astrocystis sublimbata]|nr:hypothetical protein F4808DRAFT_399407 [Astrocystis sublimbata]
MSSHSTGSYTYGSSSSQPVVIHDTLRSYKSKDHVATRTERVTGNHDSVVYQHNARGYDSHAPTPNYGHSASYPASSRAQR